jgi:predicted Zn-dependent peptidase
VLGSGKASRLYRDLVVAGLAASMDVWLDDNELASIIGVEAMVASGVPVARVEQAIEKSLRALGDAGPSPGELGRAKKTIFVELASSLQLLNSGAGEGGRSGVLQKLNHYLGDPGQLPKEMQHLRAVTGQEVQAAVQTHLTSKRQLTVVTLPKPPAAPPAKADK